MESQPPSVAAETPRQPKTPAVRAAELYKLINGFSPTEPMSAAWEMLGEIVLSTENKWTQARNARRDLELRLIAALRERDEAKVIADKRGDIIVELHDLRDELRAKVTHLETQIWKQGVAESGEPMGHKALRDYIAHIESELAEARETIKAVQQTSAAIAQAGSPDYGQILAALAELRADKERLDWLERNINTVAIEEKVPGLVFGKLRAQPLNRAAIDAAMKEGK